MKNMIRIRCENNQKCLEVEMGTPLTAIAEELGEQPYPFLAATVNNRIKELHYRVYTPATVRFVDCTSFQGVRVVQRTAWFILQGAIRRLYPERTLHIRHSLGLSGFYCEISGFDAISEEQTAAIREAMQEIIDQNVKIERTKLPSEEVRARYAAYNYTDKIELLDSRPRLYSDLQTMGDEVGYFFGPLAPTSGCVTLFDIKPYYGGFQLTLPMRSHPCELAPEVRQEKITEVFAEYQSWVGMMGMPTVGAINRHIQMGNAGSMIKVAEAFHERKYAQIADAIHEANRTKGTRIVLISGPSSSGKTTSAKRISIQLGVLGLEPILISLDDYFVERDKTPLDENGEYDFEALEAIDLKLFNDHLQRLMAGEEVEIPRYDFITGRRRWHEEPLRLTDRSVLIIEGIHGLNPKLTPAIPENQKFRVYISCLTSVAMDNTTRIATTDNRLLRRLIRDYRSRGASAIDTLARWASVRRGEEKHIFPYQENADQMLNSSLFYEFSVLRPFAEPLLREVPNTVPEYDEARRMLQLLDNFTPMAPDEISHTSVLREFIGGSTFNY